VSTVSRYLVGAYLRAFVLVLLFGTALFLVVDLVDRLADYAEYSPTPASMATFYALRLPRILTDVYPAVSLLAVLTSLGALARRREILALQACGVSDFQLAAPLLAAAGLISVAVFAWSELVVPPTAAEARRVKDVVIKKNRDMGMLDARSLWFQDAQGFVNIEYFDALHDTVHGLSLYVVDDRFRLRRIVEVPSATWRGGRWEMGPGKVREVASDGAVSDRPLQAGDLRLDDAPSALAKRRPHAEEFTVRELRRRISNLEAKGLDADPLRVDLHAKLALPLSGVVSVLLGFPLGARGGRRFGLGYNVTVGLAVGFAYWVALAIAMSAGRIGVLPAPVAAWSANAIFACAGLLLARSRHT
jgi:lipopolysaccharide export system permease protein